MTEEERELAVKMAILVYQSTQELSTLASDETMRDAIQQLGRTTLVMLLLCDEIAGRQAADLLGVIIPPLDRSKLN